jgi:hypothetical protein
MNIAKTIDHTNIDTEATRVDIIRTCEEAKKYGRTKTDIEKQELGDKSPKFWLGKERDEKTKEKNTVFIFK